MAKKKWIVSVSDKETAAKLAERIGISPVAALIAVSRGIGADGGAEEFFGINGDSLSDPFLITDMEKAASRINAAIDDFERIAVFGDYDADGVTATALLCSYLEIRGADFFYSLPTREEGYGLTKDVIDRLKNMGANLIVTVDNGINSVEEAEYAASLGMDMVITDHHQPGDVLPSAYAVVDPHRRDDKSKFKDFAGVGVAFKLVCAMEGGESTEALLLEFGDLAAIGTIGDIVPLIGENRIIVKYGVSQINKEPRPGISAMISASGNGGKAIDSTGVAFTIAPRLNAAGRMGSAERALDILLCDDEDRAESLAEEIENANSERHKTEIRIVECVEKQLLENPSYTDGRVIVCDGEGWHQGVIGIVASKIVEKYGKPCIIITREGDTAKGSGRSLDGFSLFDALSACSGCLTRFGGHVLAAGLGLESKRIDEFRTAINEYAKKIKMPFPVQRIDLKLNPKYISLEIIDAIASLEPFGAGNPQPVFGLFKMKIDAIVPLKDGKHLRLNLSKGDTKISAILFGTSPESFPFYQGSLVDVAVTLSINVYMGETRIGVYVKNIRLSDIEYDGYFEGLRAYDEIKCGEKPDLGGMLVPDRNYIGKVYKAIKQNGGKVKSADELCLMTGNTGEGVCPLLITLDVLRELGIVKAGGEKNIEIDETHEKVDLENSGILKRARNAVM
ncbi:MAG: single-stranded-DNA-specific exonuclease RecJ [Clostridiales bacterium]|nr:single-stranded-DNA-specific exonuclease RecJ [Clostridiales bacterium]